ncbi:FAD-binding oxidoreductase [Nocardioides euryhalodurans]|uniref:FAD-binding protein n=1 Tax=Nocardioides euryhalodurans TaxID=2518370 RepID=A0A4P7GM71_9ACTN|nr:FAD-linked oxidase C-terminal domain-containing protein [Nocardioides euryhalodurans]QBR92851.1 FAD-binding protein [Nocardioides euryhalodurans]
MSDWLEELRGLLPADVLVEDPDVVAAYAVDRAGQEHGTARALARVRTTEQVSTCLEVADRHGTPVVTRGAGSGLCGGANALDGCLLLSTERLDRVVELDRANRVMVVEPGVVTATIRSLAAEAGLHYPPDPGSVGFATIGGNVATNAGGLCCVKYGVTGDFVRALEVVLPSGEVVRTGHRTVKGVAGLDLTSLLVGSEGALGVITGITLGLLPAPPPAATVVATFDEFTDAGRAIAEVVAQGLVPSLLEVMDRATVTAVDRMTGMGLGEPAAMLLAQSDTTHAAEDAERLAGIFTSCGATDIAHTDDAEEGAQLMAARRLAYEALEPLGTLLVDDVCVPVDQLPGLIATIERIADEVGLTIATVGHAGDGNLHPNIVHDGHDPASVAAARRAFDAILTAALEVGGTVTGEHGVGRLKPDWVGREVGPVSARLQAGIKEVFDPHGILNPGRGLPLP